MSTPEENRVRAKELAGWHRRGNQGVAEPGSGVSPETTERPSAEQIEAALSVWRYGYTVEFNLPFALAAALAVRGDGGTDEQRIEAAMWAAEARGRADLLDCVQPLAEGGPGMSDEVAAEHRGYNIALVDLASIALQLNEAVRSPAVRGDGEARRELEEQVEEYHDAYARERCGSVATSSNSRRVPRSPLVVDLPGPVPADERLTIGERLVLRWWAFCRWLRHCPGCGRRGYDPHSPRWENDKVAQMLGIAARGCPCCGKETP